MTIQIPQRQVQERRRPCQTGAFAQLGTSSYSKHVPMYLRVSAGNVIQIQGPWIILIRVSLLRLYLMVSRAVRDQEIARQTQGRRGCNFTPNNTRLQIVGAGCRLPCQQTLHTNR